MALHIVVCVKSTPSSVNIGVDAAGQPKTAGIPTAMNPFDEFAVEEAVRLKERVPGSTATALTVGPEAAAESLREAVARGVDAGALVSGAEFEGGDSLATSRALAAAIKKLHESKPVHLVIFGKNTSDVGAGVVGTQTAAWLDWASASAIKKIDEISEQSAVVTRMMEDGVDTVKLTLPACVATIKEINEPRLPSLKGKMASKKAVFPKWTAADLGLQAGQVGAAGSGAALVKAALPPARPAGLKIEGASAAEKAAKLVDVLVDRKLI
ncbi:MAG: electron transfer flavoprotein subunit beta/FixA family protein [Elusimicrobia bacterium]|nr:electron transfer flavoprotein subunit beta/FixA family protein [Elusimicrobiota bacterium]